MLAEVFRFKYVRTVLPRGLNPTAVRKNHSPYSRETLRRGMTSRKICGSVEVGEVSIGARRVGLQGDLPANLEHLLLNAIPRLLRGFVVDSSRKVDVDNLTADQRTRTMRAVRGRDTTPELQVRRIASSLGYRYRLHSRRLPGCPDLVFPSAKKAIFVHGCFWHGHGCRSGTNRPKSNISYWNEKLDRNRARDAENRVKLRRVGWRALVIWECELQKEEKVRRKIAAFLAR